MGIVKLNNYLSDRYLSDLANNVDYNRLHTDKTNISVNFGTSPATVSIKQGSMIEANGNSYTVNGGDYDFQMANGTDNYIAFSEGPPVIFKSVSLKGSYQNGKLGVYQSDNLTRTIRWYIDQTEETYNIDDSLQSFNIGDLKTEQNSYRVENTTSGFAAVTHNFSSTGSQNTTTNFLLKKPVTFAYDMSTTASATIRFEIDIQFNSTWYQVFTTGVGQTGSFAGFIGNYTPAQYRITSYYTGGVGGDSAVTNLRIIGAYGQTNFGASSVYV